MPGETNLPLPEPEEIPRSEKADEHLRRRLEELKEAARNQGLLNQADKIRQEMAGTAPAETPSVASEPFMGNPRPYKVSAQAKLFKSGLMGSAVTVWSKVDGEGGHEPRMVMHDAETPVIIRLTEDNSEDVDQQIAFASGYVYGWVEKVGGESALDRLEIWLEPVVLQGSETETPA